MQAICNVVKNIINLTMTNVSPNGKMHICTEAHISVIGVLTQMPSRQSALIINGGQ